ncbi:MAG: MmcQ/YjbR family DNA-binding protein [Pseudomonadota bacterium]
MVWDAVDKVCGALPGAEKSDPWGGGHEAWKIGGKMFACIGSVTPGISVKTPDTETVQMLIDAGVGRKAPYFHKSWILLPPETDAAELRHRLVVAYGVVRKGLTKSVQATLPPWPDA